MDANSLLWAGQILLALGVFAAGYGHSIGYHQSVARRGMAWLGDVGQSRMRVIGSLEILAAVGLILPGLTRVLPWLTPAAAALIVALMVFAAVFHARRPGEATNIVANLVLELFAAIIAYGRFVVAPF